MAVPRIYDTNTAASHGLDGLQISVLGTTHCREETTRACQQRSASPSRGLHEAGWRGGAQRAMAGQRSASWARWDDRGGGLRLDPRDNNDR